MQSVSPVFTAEEAKFEIEIAKNQREYVSVIGLPVTLQIIDPETNESKIVPNWAIACRFRLSEEERAQVAAGLDIVVTQLTFGKDLAPMNLQFCEPGVKPQFEMRADPPASAEKSPLEWPKPAHCPACVNGQSLEAGEGTHLEGTEEHPANQTEQPSEKEDQPQS